MGAGGATAGSAQTARAPRLVHRDRLGGEDGSRGCGGPMAGGTDMGMGTDMGLVISSHHSEPRVALHGATEHFCGEESAAIFEYLGENKNSPFK